MAAGEENSICKILARFPIRQLRVTFGTATFAREVDVHVVTEPVDPRDVSGPRSLLTSTYCVVPRDTFLEDQEMARKRLETTVASDSPSYPLAVCIDSLGDKGTQNQSHPRDWRNAL